MISHRHTQIQSWSCPPFQPTLGEHDVDIWRASLEAHPMFVQRSIKLLSHDEIARADKFYFAGDRDKFIVARAFLRIITGYYLSVDPCELRFEYGKHGKPSLANAVKDGRRLEIGANYMAAIAVEGHDWRPNYWNVELPSRPEQPASFGNFAFVDDSTMRAESWLAAREQE